jgi:hypothetical protein
VGKFEDFFEKFFEKRNKNENIVLERAKKDAAKWNMPYDELYYEYMRAWQKEKDRLRKLSDIS